MTKIEQLQKDFGLFLTEIPPVPWVSVCFWAEVQEGCCTYWFCLKEKKTNEVCTCESFFERYNEYPISRRDMKQSFYEYASELHKAYLQEYGQAKIWKEMIFIVEETGIFHIDFVYETNGSSILKRRNSILSKYFGVEYKYLREKYR